MPGDFWAAALDKGCANFGLSCAGERLSDVDCRSGGFLKSSESKMRCADARCNADDGSFLLIAKIKTRKEKWSLLFPPGFEPGTFRVLGECHDQLDHRNSVAKVSFFKYIYFNYIFNLSFGPKARKICSVSSHSVKFHSKI